MKITNSSVKKLLEHYIKISRLGKVKATLDWDLNVNMPPKASAGRANQSAYLEEIMTDLWTDKAFIETVEKAQEEKNLTLEEKGLVRNLTRSLKFYTKVPKATIINLTKTTSEAFVPWREAKTNNEYNKFLPHLKKLITLEREIANHLGYKENPYDALLDLYEPELTASFTKKTFGALRDELVPLIKDIQKSKSYDKETPLISSKMHYPTPDQERLLQFIMKKQGFNMDAGRLDVSPHPFTTSLDRYDIRLTTKYTESDFRDSFTATMHETGHAIYEQGINPEYDETPLEWGVSLGIHESMSRFWENMVGKNPAFLTYMTPLFQANYPKQLGNTDEQTLVKAFNLVKPSFIRIEADEVTYSLHIILRFEMENGLINGDIKPEEAPEVWREKSKAYFGIVPEKDSDGILQDVHWTYGSFGYFPSYALGNLYGAQLLNTMKKTVAFEENLKQGNLLPIKQWLDKNIHTHGSLYLPAELIKKATGETLNPTYFVDYLKEKYSKLYNFSGK